MANKQNKAAAADKGSATKEDPKTTTPPVPPANQPPEQNPVPQSEQQPGANDENPLESAIQEQTPPADQPPEQPAQQAAEQAGTQDTGGTLADDEQPQEEEDEQDDEVPLGVEPPQIDLKPIPTPEQCLGQSEVFAGNRFLGLTSPSKMTSDQIKQEIEDLGNPAERRAKAADALGAAKLERVRLIAELDQKIAQLEENLYGVTGWAYAADHRIRSLAEHANERQEAAQKLAEQAAERKKQEKAAKAAESKAAKAAKANTTKKA